MPITYWDEAVRNASLLLNHTPHRFLNFGTPSNKLKEHNMWLEQELDYSKILPFGYKVPVRKLTNFSKAAEKTITLCGMTNEQYSDAMRVLDIDLGKIVIIWDFIVTFTFRSSTAQNQMKTLPNKVRNSQYQSVKLPAPQLPNLTNPNSDDAAATPSTGDPEPVARAQGSQMRGWDYVPYYNTAPKKISSRINEQKIIKHSCRTTRRSNQELLTNVVSYSKAIGNTQEKENWQDAMNTEFNSLMQHNTGHLVPYPTDGFKVIGGMWRLTMKRNEFGEVGSTQKPPGTHAPLF
ncbi:hypothetical protein O181_129326 [Austropuccinia psidii MF-1]|uniref:Reverse transcriptase Ty1/copia-type domain-containing protein n=1 Tax=Austropuccinia psidii MF-1 TaxID=1389203 RepID=A0A9Q3Q8G8_9BASI|nr:hypothetical protein [Austropuccinia psidii MF-1]